MNPRKTPTTGVAEPSPRLADEAEFEQTIFAAELGDAPSVDLHGLDRIDAIRELDAYIASEAARGTEAIEIIHGRGSGTLRQAVRAHLASHPLIALHRDASHPGKQGGVMYAALYDARKRT